MNAAANNVLELLNYIEQAEKLKTKPAFAVPTDYFVAHQHEFNGLPGVQVNLQPDNDEVWLRISRLKEIVPPEAVDRLKPYLIVQKSPEKAPALNAAALNEAQESIPEVKVLFDWYVENLWQPWAQTEIPRRHAIALYNKLFSLQQTISAEGAETPLELVWGIGYAAWKVPGASPAVKHPLLVQACEVSLNEETLELEVRPRDVEPRLEVDCYSEMELAGVRPLEAHWKGVLSSGSHRITPFDPATYEATLKTAVGHLDANGGYLSGESRTTLPAPAENLQVADSWVLFGRKRTGDVFIQDLQRLKQNIEATPELPSVIRSLVEPGGDTVRVSPEVPFRGLATSDSATDARELYFPMAYNDEQVSIIQKLESNDGVVVQGPPGTGKTHTIANVICHYLAQGKRVLVTAKAESALAVVQEKLPERIRPLCVALLSDERDGLKQFEHSIQTIASTVSGLNPTQAQAIIDAAQQNLDYLHAKISQVDRAVEALARRHMSSFKYQGAVVTPEEMARLVLEQTREHEWFDDSPKSASPELTEPDVLALRMARLALGSRLVYLGQNVPPRSVFPDWEDMQALHRDLVKAKQIATKVSSGALFPLADSTVETFDKAKRLSAFLESRMELKKEVDGAAVPWLPGLLAHMRTLLEADPLLKALRDSCVELLEFESQRVLMLPNAIVVPTDAENDKEFLQALARLTQGHRAFVLPFGNTAARRLIEGVTVIGTAPQVEAAWQMVSDMVNWRIKARQALARWSSLATELGIAIPAATIETSVRMLAPMLLAIQKADELHFGFDVQLPARIGAVFGSTLAARAMEGEDFLLAVMQSLQAHLDKGRLSYAVRRVQSLQTKIEGSSGAVISCLRHFLSAQLGADSLSEAQIEKTWFAVTNELGSIESVAPHFETVKHITELMEKAGAPKWAARCRTVVAADADTQIPNDWNDAWQWRVAVMFLESIDKHARVSEMFKERAHLAKTLAQTYQDLVAEKTWLGVFQNSPDSVRQALQAYLNAVQSMGSGTGVRAVRHRKTARDAMVRAYKAVPCWVLPQWRVSETIPAEVGLFDLVIVDEASQSDIWALPALLRGKKLLVVGDHKQVSPSAVGTAEERVRELTQRFLSAQPYGSEMTPDKSIYDLARVVFAGNSVMLKEHFRSVPAIIEYSNREFYGNGIRPLRVPKAHERLDPPLVDVYVKGGYRKGDMNPPEALAIVQEIEKILADPQFDGCSIGVVTLLGTEQAHHIHKLISENISPADIVARKISVGPPPVFQGRERDIMMISMVLVSGDRGAANRADMAQRFNVALSRARDRMYLFRSVTEQDFKEDSLNGRVLRHFKQPFHNDVIHTGALREKCQSGFELEVFDELIKRGYRVQPQVRSGGFYIDFVVEGAEGRRLAIECDGDRFHGPGQWQADMARQRVLERAGWTFWRCFASSFVRRRDEVLADLVNTLTQLGIEPLGDEASDKSVWVSYVEADPMHVDAEHAVEHVAASTAEHVAESVAEPLED